VERTRTLSEFLRNGRLGGLSFGSSKADVRGLLGPARGPLALVWDYGALEVAFDGEAVRTITLRFDADVRLPRAVALAGWLPTRRTTFREFQRWLAGERIPYRMAIPSDRSLALQAGRAAVRFALDGTRTSLERIQA